MELAKTYDPKAVEDKWYQYWLEHKFFAAKPNPDKEPYCIVIPPPNVTGQLHMGHMLNNTIQDVLVRKARMEGKEACWVAGTDHASIATETKVVAMLKEKGIEKRNISREQFLEYAWEWKEKYGGIILEQLKKLGASCDWDRTRFTMEPSLSEAVTEIFVKLHNKGLIYRGVRMVNWDPQGRTALSDEEVHYKEVNTKLHYIKYQVVEDVSQKIGENPKSEIRNPKFLVIATTRPETIMADTAICVNPQDERYRHLHGKKAIIPLINREVPIIQDEYVSMEFGTGCLKVTPAHDLNDYELGIKHHLPVIDILNDDGTLNEKAQRYVGMDRFAVRKQIVQDLEAAGHLEKVEDYKSNVGYSERTNAVIEPKLSLQWFLKMEELAKPALDNVQNDSIQFHPPRFKNLYRSWMENIHNWTISRQLWWGHRIPAWYNEKGDFVVAATEQEAIEQFKVRDPKSEIQNLRQDEDVLDTWFSSWLWPISVFDGFKNPDNPDFKYFYPTNDLVTGFDIIFFWVARMIMAGYEFKGEKPFRNVYFTGMVRDKQGRKMSKQLGNSPDPLDLIAQYGADGVRTGMLFSSPAGNDLLFDEKLCEQGSRFNNKIWNALRLVKGWQVQAEKAENAADTKAAVRWFEAHFNQVLAGLEEQYQKFRMSDALQIVYKLAWDDFCSWYLEMIKPELGQPIDQVTYEATIRSFENILKVLHPFMPFITEEIWQQLRERKAGESICVAAYPKAAEVTEGDKNFFSDAALVFEAVTQIRNLRNSKGLSPKEALPLFIRTEGTATYQPFEGIIRKLANISSIHFTQDKVADAAGFMVKADEFYVPLSMTVDVEKEREKLTKDLEYSRGFHETTLKKLSNERFVSNAKPEVVAAEKQKLADAAAKIKALEEAISRLG